VTLAIAYDRAAGVDHFYVDDETTGVELFYSGYAPGTGQTYNQARVGRNSLLAVGSFTYNAPATETNLVTFQDSFPGHLQRQPVQLLQLVEPHKILATSNGTSTGTVKSGHNNYSTLAPTSASTLNPEQ